MADLKNEIFVCIDCETTGLDAKNDKIIEVAAVRFTMDEVLDQFEALVNPECSIPDSSIEIHHITQEMVADKPKIHEILPDLLKLVGEHIIIGHGIAFDIQLVAIAAKRSNTLCNIHKNLSIDTLRMARLYGESPVNSLEQLRRHFNIGFEGTHRAMGDALVNMEVFKKLSNDYKTTKQIFDALSKPILFKIMPLGKHKGRPLRDIPLDYLRWAAGKDFDQDLLYSLRTEINRRKQGNLFSQVSNPFSQL